LIDHEGGSKVVAGRQDASHAHWAGFSNDQRFVMVPDLGLDQVVIYSFDAEKSQLKPSGAAATPPGSGPRHMKFHQNNQHALVLNELSLTVTSFAYHAKLGQMNPLETVATVPENEKAKEQAVSASEICIHPNGKFGSRPDHRLQVRRTNGKSHGN
jgi:6-phosphogluconolactonase